MAKNDENVVLETAWPALCSGAKNDEQKNLNHAKASKQVIKSVPVI